MKTQCLQLFPSAESEVLGISDLMRTLTYPVHRKHFVICFLRLDAEQRYSCAFCSVCILGLAFMSRLTSG